MPDSKDRHVLVAAIKAQADIIVTFNVKDFPARKVNPYKVAVIHPDNFIIKIIENNNSSALIALHNQAQRLKKPPLTIADILETLKKCGLNKTVPALKKIL